MGGNFLHSQRQLKLDGGSEDIEGLGSVDGYGLHDLNAVEAARRGH